MADTATRTLEVSEDKSEDGSILLEYGDSIDPVIFGQILEMDDDEERKFSRSIVFGFFEQADDTFKGMDGGLESRDLSQLSSLGHFLRGSSATLGLTKVKDSCEKIQHYGARKDETGTKDEPSEDVCLKHIKDTLALVREEYNEVEKVLKRFYDAQGSSVGDGFSIFRASDECSRPKPPEAPEAY